MNPKGIVPRNAPLCRSVAPLCWLAGSVLLAAACSSAQKGAPPAKPARQVPDTSPVRLGTPQAAPANWIDNGDFSVGLSPWGVHAIAAAPGHEARAEPIDGVLCAQMMGGENVILGWPVSGSPQHFKLELGESYQVALRTSVSGDLAVRCVVKIGHQREPYTGAFSAPIPTQPAWTAFKTHFTPDHADDRAGLAVECQSQAGNARAQVCIDDVSLYPSMR